MGTGATFAAGHPVPDYPSGSERLDRDKCGVVVACGTPATAETDGGHLQGRRSRPAAPRLTVQRMQSFVTAAVLLAVVPQLHAADSVEWRVGNAADGDTITCLDDGNTQHRIRIDGIDAPERGQPFGQASKRALSDLVCFAPAACYFPHGP